MVDIIVKYAS